jgi:hypothetical protein
VRSVKYRRDLSKVGVMPRKHLTGVLSFFIALIVGAMLYLFSSTLEESPLFDDAASNIASDVTNAGYPP